MSCADAHAGAGRIVIPEGESEGMTVPPAGMPAARNEDRSMTMSDTPRRPSR
jgi:hypothetical protein